LQSVDFFCIENTTEDMRGSDNLIMVDASLWQTMKFCFVCF